MTLPTFYYHGHLPNSDSAILTVYVVCHKQNGRRNDADRRQKFYNGAEFLLCAHICTLQYYFKACFYHASDTAAERAICEAIWSELI